MNIREPQLCKFYPRQIVPLLGQTWLNTERCCFNPFPHLSHKYHGRIRRRTHSISRIQSPSLITNPENSMASSFLPNNAYSHSLAFSLLLNFPTSFTRCEFILSPFDFILRFSTHPLIIILQLVASCLINLL